MEIQGAVNVYLNGEVTKVLKAQLKAWQAEGKRFIYVEEQKLYVPVTEEQYLGFYRPKWREDKREAAFHEHVKESSYEGLRELRGDFLEDKFSVVDSELLRKEMHEALISEINKLEESDREILLLWAEGMSETKIAEKIGRPQTTINYRKLKAFEHLKNSLGNFI